MLKGLRKLKFLPSNNREFSALFREQVQKIEEIAQLFQQLIDCHETETQQQLHKKIKRIESEADDILTRIKSACEDSLIPPFISADILDISRLLDDIVDGIEGAADDFIEYKIEMPPSEIISITEIVVKASMKIHAIVPALEKFEHPIDLYGEMRELEHLADVINKKGIPKFYLEVEEAARQLSKMGSVLKTLKGAQRVIDLISQTIQMQNRAIAIDKVITRLEKTTDTLRQVTFLVRGVISKNV